MYLCVFTVILTQNIYPVHNIALLVLNCLFKNSNYYH